ncbi:autotransporter outer membrane beta-barrel domain-containing protein [Escherichia coli]|nr:autotransporter outer membrane beta-barrel domain-containing protein [Escherichia coli]
MKVTPYAGVKLRHTLEGGYQERNAGDFNLNMNSGSETAVDSIVGLKLDYAGKDGWSASATLEGGPNLSYAKSQRTASPWQAQAVSTLMSMTVRRAAASTAWQASA